MRAFRALSLGLAAITPPPNRTPDTSSRWAGGFHFQQHRPPQPAPTRNNSVLLISHTSNVKRTCKICGTELSVRRLGRVRQYCSVRCRKAAFRSTEFEKRWPSAQTPAKGRNDSKKLTNTNSCKGEKSDQAPAKSGPIIALGRGCYTTPQPAETSSARAKLIASALRTELASRWLRPVSRRVHS